MDSLLSVSFTNLSSNNPDRIRKGLKQIDGLLAQICLYASPTSGTKPTKSLQDLNEDPAFAEFYRLQERFEWNLSSQLTETLDRLLSFAELSGDLIHRTLDTLAALLLLHPPSRILFARRPALLSVLDLLEPTFIASFGDMGNEILCHALTTLMIAMMDTPRVSRAFEKEGLETVIKLHRQGGVVWERAKELLAVWMLPEASRTQTQAQAQNKSSTGSNGSRRTGTARRLPTPEADKLRPRKMRDASQTSEGSSVLGGLPSESLRSPEEKAKMLRRTRGGDQLELAGLFAEGLGTGSARQES